MYAQLYVDLQPWFQKGEIRYFSLPKGGLRNFAFENGIFSSDGYTLSGGDFPDQFLNSLAAILPAKAFSFAFNNYDEPRSLPATDKDSNSYNSLQDTFDHNDCMEAKRTKNAQHGFFIGPDSFVAENMLAPIFSQTKIDCFKDILLPLAYHIGSSKPSPSIWKEKLNVLFWRFTSNALTLRRGSTTGGHYGSNNQWRKYHRTKLIEWEHNYRKKHPEIVFETGKDDIEKLDYTNTRIDIGFSSFVQHDEETEQAILSEFGLKSRVAFEVSVRFKYLLVVDGNTWPARLQAYLQTGSVILYNGIFTDWFNWKLVPFVHYVPVALDYSDLDQVVKWLVDNDELAHQIAINAAKFMETYSDVREMKCYAGLALLEYSNLYKD